MMTSESPKFLAWAEYEYLAEEADRALAGRWSEYDPDSWVPFDLAAAERIARGIRREVERRHGVTLRMSDPERVDLDRWRITHADLGEWLRRRGIIDSPSTPRMRPPSRSGSSRDA